LAENEFSGPFAKEMSDFVELKMALGYKYTTERGILKRFGSFLSSEYDDLDSLSKEAVTKWCSKTLHETDNNHCSRASLVRQFSKYLNSIGIKAWVLPNKYYPKGNKYIPHIYTPDELTRFFSATDKCTYCSEVPYRHLIMPVFFRLLLSSGLRCSEARMLTVDDVDLDLGMLKISDSKNHNDRLVPLSKTMLIRLQRYSEQVHSSGSHEFFFPGYKEKPMTLGNVYKNFRRFLWKSGISHTGDGPRVHDFRHTYCVFKLREWAEQGKDLMVLIPLMRTYLGHQTFNETAYYLKWTADVFPDIRLKLERYCEGIIPEMEELQ
jgi:integrase